MTGVALKGLLGRKTRTILTALAIVLGVAMMSGTFVLTDTIEKAFTSVFTSSYQRTSVVISGKEIVKDSVNQPTVPASLLTKVRALPGIAGAAGGIFDSVELVDRDGEALGGGGAPTFGFGVDPRQPRFSGIRLTEGTWAVGPGQVVIDSGTASRYGYAVGSTIGAKGDGPIRRYRIVGIGKLGGVSIGSATMAVFDLATAQAILDKRGRYDQISAAAKPGVPESRLVAEMRGILPPTVQVKTGAEQASAVAEDVSAGISAMRAFLLAFAGIALFVGAFVIFNTLSITVAQRAREFATLRTLGASRRQVLRSVLLESLVIGSLASLLGLVLGLGLAKGLNALFVALGVDLPQTGTVVATRTVLVSLLVGTTVTLVAGLVPAFRATRVPAISAVRERAVLPNTRLARYRSLLAALITALGTAMIAYGLFVSSGAKAVLIPIGAGTLLLFVGVALISSYLVRPLAAIVGHPARRLGGIPGRLATENSVRNSGRTAATAAALMVGLALITFVATFGSGLRSSVVEALNEQVTADYVVSASVGAESGLFPSAAGDALSVARGVTLASSVRSDQARVFGKSTNVVGVDPATIARVYRFQWTDGSDSLLRELGDGAIVDSSYAKSHDLEVGSPIPLVTPSGVRRTFVVKALYDPPQAFALFGGIVISEPAFDRIFPRPANLFSFVDVKGGASDAAGADLEQALIRFPDTTVRTKTDWVGSQAADINTTLGIFYVLLALSVLVSLFGMVNTLILSVFERTREIGMLRAVGLTRRQTRRMVRQESIITALIGAALGLPLGVFLAALVTRALSSEGVEFNLPVASLVIFTALAVLAGTLAAVLPARRAARLNVLEALQYE